MDVDIELPCHLRNNFILRNRIAQFVPFGDEPPQHQESIVKPLCCCLILLQLLFLLPSIIIFLCDFFDNLLLFTLVKLALLADEYGELVDVWDGEHLGHEMVAEVPWRHLHRLPRFPQLVDRRGEDDLELAVAEAVGGEEHGVSGGGAAEEEGGAGGGHGASSVIKHQTGDT